MHIHISGAGEHNLKDVDVSIGDGLTVVTGVSGSGKTSLVFDTLTHEARRRFLDIFAPGSNALRMPPAAVRVIATPIQSSICISVASAMVSGHVWVVFLHDPPITGAPSSDPRHEQWAAG